MDRVTMPKAFASCDQDIKLTCAPWKGFALSDIRVPTLLCLVSSFFMLSIAVPCFLVEMCMASFIIMTQSTPVVPSALSN